MAKPLQINSNPLSQYYQLLGGHHVDLSAVVIPHHCHQLLHYLFRCDASSTVHGILNESDTKSVWMSG